MKFPVDLLADVSQTELEKLAQNYMNNLLYSNVDSPEHLSLPDSSKVAITISNVGFVPLYGSSDKQRILALFSPSDPMTAVALFLLDQWYTVDDILKTADPARDGAVEVETIGERIVLYILNRVIYRVKEMSPEELPFLCHGEKDYAKILWNDGEAVGFYSVKPSGSMFNSFSTTSYQLPVMDSVFVRKCQRGKGFGLQLLEDFVLSFKDDCLGLRYPLTKSMYKVCEKFLYQYPGDTDLLWEVKGVGGPNQRTKITSNIQAMDHSAVSKSLSFTEESLVITEMTEKDVVMEEITTQITEAKSMECTVEIVQEVTVLSGTEVSDAEVPLTARGRSSGSKRRKMAEDKSEKIIRIEDIEAETPREEQVSVQQKTEVHIVSELMKTEGMFNMAAGEQGKDVVDSASEEAATMAEQPDTVLAPKLVEEAHVTSAPTTEESQVKDDAPQNLNNTSCDLQITVENVASEVEEECQQEETAELVVSEEVLEVHKETETPDKDGEETQIVITDDKSEERVTQYEASPRNESSENDEAGKTGGTVKKAVTTVQSKTPRRRSKRHVELTEAQDAGIILRGRTVKNTSTPKRTHGRSQKVHKESEAVVDEEAEQNEVSTVEVVEELSGTEGKEQEEITSVKDDEVVVEEKQQLEDEQLANEEKQEESGVKDTVVDDTSTELPETALTKETEDGSDKEQKSEEEETSVIQEEQATDKQIDQQDEAVEKTEEEISREELTVEEEGTTSKAEDVTPLTEEDMEESKEVQKEEENKEDTETVSVMEAEKEEEAVSVTDVEEDVVPEPDTVPVATETGTPDTASEEPQEKESGSEIPRLQKATIILVDIKTREMKNKNEKTEQAEDATAEAETVEKEALEEDKSEKEVAGEETATDEAEGEMKAVAEDAVKVPAAVEEKASSSQICTDREADSPIGDDAQENLLAAEVDEAMSSEEEEAPVVETRALRCRAKPSTATPRHKTRSSKKQSEAQEAEISKEEPAMTTRTLRRGRISASVTPQAKSRKSHKQIQKEEKKGVEESKSVEETSAPTTEESQVKDDGPQDLNNTSCDSQTVENVASEIEEECQQEETAELVVSEEVLEVHKETETPDKDGEETQIVITDVKSEERVTQHEASPINESSENDEAGKTGGTVEKAVTTVQSKTPRRRSKRHVELTEAQDAGIILRGRTVKNTSTPKRTHRRSQKVHKESEAEVDEEAEQNEVSTVEVVEELSGTEVKEQEEMTSIKDDEVVVEEKQQLEDEQLANVEKQEESGVKDTVVDDTSTELPETSRTKETEDGSDKEQKSEEEETSVIQEEQATDKQIDQQDEAVDKTEEEISREELTVEEEGTTSKAEDVTPLTEEDMEESKEVQKEENKEDTETVSVMEAEKEEEAVDVTDAEEDVVPEPDTVPVATETGTPDTASEEPQEKESSSEIPRLQKATVILVDIKTREMKNKNEKTEQAEDATAEAETVEKEALEEDKSEKEVAGEETATDEAEGEMKAVAEDAVKVPAAAEEKASSSQICTDREADSPIGDDAEENLPAVEVDEAMSSEEEEAPVVETRALRCRAKLSTATPRRKTRSSKKQVEAQEAEISKEEPAMTTRTLRRGRICASETPQGKSRKSHKQIQEEEKRGVEESKSVEETGIEEEEAADEAAVEKIEKEIEEKVEVDVKEGVPVAEQGQDAGEEEGPKESAEETEVEEEKEEGLLSAEEPPTTKDDWKAPEDKTEVEKEGLVAVEEETGTTKAEEEECTAGVIAATFDFVQEEETGTTLAEPSADSAILSCTHSAENQQSEEMAPQFSDLQRVTVVLVDMRKSHHGAHEETAAAEDSLPAQKTADGAEKEQSNETMKEEETVAQENVPGSPVGIGNTELERVVLEEEEGEDKVEAVTVQDTYEGRAEEKAKREEAKSINDEEQKPTVTETKTLRSRKQAVEATPRTTGKKKKAEEEKEESSDMQEEEPAVQVRVLRRGRKSFPATQTCITKRTHKHLQQEEGEEGGEESTAVEEEEKQHQVVEEEDRLEEGDAVVQVENVEAEMGRDEEDTVAEETVPQEVPPEQGQANNIETAADDVTESSVGQLTDKGETVDVEEAVTTQDTVEKDESTSTSEEGDDAAGKCVEETEKDGEAADVADEEEAPIVETKLLRSGEKTGRATTRTKATKRQNDDLEEEAAEEESTEEDEPVVETRVLRRGRRSAAATPRRKSKRARTQRQTEEEGEEEDNPPEEIQEEEENTEPDVETEKVEAVAEESVTEQDAPEEGQADITELAAADVSETPAGQLPDEGKTLDVAEEAVTTEDRVEREQLMARDNEAQGMLEGEEVPVTDRVLRSGEKKARATRSKTKKRHDDQEEEAAEEESTEEDEPVIETRVLRRGRRSAAATPRRKSKRARTQHQTEEEGEEEDNPPEEIQEEEAKAELEEVEEKEESNDEKTEDKDGDEAPALCEENIEPDVETEKVEAMAEESVTGQETVEEGQSAVPETCADGQGETTVGELVEETPNTDEGKETVEEEAPTVETKTVDVDEEAVTTQDAVEKDESTSTSEEGEGAAGKCVEETEKDGEAADVADEEEAPIVETKLLRSGEKTGRATTRTKATKRQNDDLEEEAAEEESTEEDEPVIETRVLRRGRSAAATPRRESKRARTQRQTEVEGEEEDNPPEEIEEEEDNLGQEPPEEEGEQVEEKGKHMETEEDNNVEEDEIESAAEGESLGDAEQMKGAVEEVAGLEEEDNSVEDVDEVGSDTVKIPSTEEEEEINSAEKDETAVVEKSAAAVEVRSDTVTAEDASGVSEEETPVVTTRALRSKERKTSHATPLRKSRRQKDQEVVDTQQEEETTPEEQEEHQRLRKRPRVDYRENVEDSETEAATGKEEEDTVKSDEHKDNNKAECSDDEATEKPDINLALDSDEEVETAGLSEDKDDEENMSEEEVEPVVIGKRVLRGRIVPSVIITPQRSPQSAQKRKSLGVSPTRKSKRLSRV